MAGAIMFDQNSFDTGAFSQSSFLFLIGAKALEPIRRFVLQIKNRWTN